MPTASSMSWMSSHGRANTSRTARPRSGGCSVSPLLELPLFSLSRLRCRFWWRDTRLAELPRFAPPPTAGFQFQFSLATMSDGGVSTAAAAATAPSTPSAGGAAGTYTFSYPVSFVPVPYHTDTTAAALCTTIIPAARAPRMISVVVPGPVVLPSAPYAMSVVDAATCVEVHSDGLLLYVAQAAYESGTSPLACWVPRTNLLDAFERYAWPRPTCRRVADPST